MRRKERKLEREKFVALRGYALKYDIEPRFDYDRPGNSNPERAFQLLSCGFDMMIVLLGSAFPSLSRRTAKTGSKWSREGLVYYGANGAGYMGRVCATLFAEMRGRLGDEAEDDLKPVEDPELHLSMRRSLEDFFPLLDARKTAVKAKGAIDPLVEACVAEFEVMRTGTPRKDVAEGTQTANGYSAALLRGEDPNRDPELVQQQRRYARDYFIHQAALGTMLNATYETDALRLQRKTFPVLDPNDPDHSEYRKRALAAWAAGSRPYREYALIEFESSSRPGKQPAPTEAQ